VASGRHGWIRLASTFTAASDLSDLAHLADAVRERMLPMAASTRVSSVGWPKRSRPSGAWPVSPLVRTFKSGCVCARGDGASR
jgi:hypothetical protein